MDGYSKKAMVEIVNNIVLQAVIYGNSVEGCYGLNKEKLVWALKLYSLTEELDARVESITVRDEYGKGWTIPQIVLNNNSNNNN